MNLPASNLDFRGVSDRSLKNIYSQILREMQKRESLRGIAEADGRSIFKRIKKAKKGRHIEDLLAPEWDEIFPDAGGDKRFYVYAHVQPNTKPVCIKHEAVGGKVYIKGNPFYIGKGCSQRAWDLARNEGHGAQLKSILAIGSEPEKIVCILRDKLSESEALKLESKLLYFLGTKFELGTKGQLVNLDLPKRPMHLK